MKVKLFNTIVLLLALTSSLVWAVSAQELASPVQPEMQSTQVEAALRSSPMMFIENVGQFPDAVRFQVRGGRNIVWLSEDAVWLTVLGPPGDEPEQQGPPSTPQPSQVLHLDSPRIGTNVKLTFVGAHPHPRIEPFDRLETHISYFIGSDPTRWHADVPAWGGVRYLDLYPGVDLEMIARDGQGVWRVVARDGASLEMIQLQVDGADALALDGSDRLLIRSTEGAVYGPPVVLIRDRRSARPRIEGQVVKFALTIGSDDKPTRQEDGLLALGSLEAPQTCLVESAHPYANSFDFTWTVTNPQVNMSYSRVHFSRLETEAGYDKVYVMDNYGSVVQTISGSYPTGLWSDPVPGRVVKVRLTSDGSVTGWGFCVDTITSVATGELAYSTFLGGSGFDAGNAIAAGSGGIAYIAGETTSTNFPTTPGSFDVSSNGSRDVFVTKLLSAGNGLAFSTFIGGAGDDRATDIAVDATGAAYLIGESTSSNFPTTPSTFDSTYNGNRDVVAVKLGAAGNALLYSTYIGGGSKDQGFGLALDGAGNAYLTGYTESSNFPVTAGALRTSYGGSGDGFVVKLAPTSTGVQYSTYLGSPGWDVANDVAVDLYGSAYVVGLTQSGAFPTTPGAFDTTFAGVQDAFVVKLNASGSSLIYSGLLGGNFDDQAQAVAVDVFGAAYVAGQTGSADFTTTAGAFDRTRGGNWDGFVAKVSPDGSRLIYSTYLGGSSNDCETPGVERECKIAADASGVAYVAGRTFSIDFPTTANGFDLSHNGNEDGFMVKVSPDGSSLVYSSFFGGSNNDQTLAVAVDTAGAAYTAGRTDSSNFPTSPGAYDTTYNSGTDAFVIKLGVGGYTTGPRPDPNNSTISAQPASVPADGVTAATISVQLLSAAGEPAWGKTVRLTSNRGAQDDIIQPAEVTNSSGRTTGLIRSGAAGVAVITAFVYDEGVLLSHTASVTFDPHTPPSAFQFRLNQMVDTGIRSLNELRDDAETIANDGTYFRGAVAGDIYKLGGDVFFGMMDVVGGVRDAQRLNKGIQLALPGMTQHLDGPFWPGILNPEQSFPHASNLFRSDIQALVRYSPAAQTAEELAYTGAKFFTASLRNSLLKKVAKDTAKSGATTIFLNLDDGMSSVAYPAVRDTSDDLARMLNMYRSHVLSNLPAMTPSYQSAYEGDFTGRTLALLTLGQQLDNERMTLANFRVVHDQKPDELLNFLLRFTAKTAATAVFDGPGTVAVGGSLLLFDGYMDGKQLNESLQMYDLACKALLGAPDAMSQIYNTTYSGLNRVAHGYPANRATGRINYVTHYSQGGDWRQLWQEVASWSEVSLTNTGGSETTYRILTGYLADTTRFGLPWATMNIVEEPTITLAAGASGIVRVDYKRAAGTRGFSPRSRMCLRLAGCVPASDISIQVLGTNEAGTYYIGNDSSVWQPTRLTLTGVRAAAIEDDLPAIDPPLTAYVLSAPWTQKHEAQLWINNPFSSTVAVTVRQTLPAGITLLDLGGATQSGNTLTWNTAVEASALNVVTFTFMFAAVPGTGNTLPPATLNLTSPLDGQPLTANANSASFQAIWPVTVDHATPGYILPHSNATAVMTVTNWLANQAVAGTLTLKVTVPDTGAVEHSQTQSFNVGAGATAGVSFALPTSLAEGNHLILGSVSANGAAADIFTDTLQVGLPGPWLDYRVTPMGPANPNDVLTYTLRFTNTVGVPLTNAVVTASLPISVTVVAGSVTGGGVVQPGQVWWALGTININQVAERSFAVRVNPNAAPPFGSDPGRLVSEPRLTASEIAPTWGPSAWNLVPANVQLIHPVFLPLILVSSP